MVPVATILKEALELPTELRAELVGELMRTLPAKDVPPQPPPRDEGVTWEAAQAFLED